MESTDLNLFNLSIDQDTRSELERCAKWAKVMAVVAFISAVLSMILAFISPEYEDQRMLMVMITLMMTVVTVVINIFLYRFSTKTTAAIQRISQQDLAEGISGLQNYFKVMGIIFIIILSICILAIPAFVIFVSMGMNA